MADHKRGSLILVNARVLTMDAARPAAEAVAVENGLITAVGDRDTVLRLKSSDSETLDLRGGVLLPGFVDSHVHAFATGLALTSADLKGARDVAEVCARVADHGRQTEHDRWLLGLGCEPWQLREGRFPTAAELDAVTGDRPSFITSATFHSSTANSAALKTLVAADPELAKPRDTPHPEWFLDDDSHFRATQVAFGSLDDARIRRLYRQVADLAASKGVTTLHCLEGQFIDGDRDVEVLHRYSADLPVHVILMYQTMDVDRVVSLGLPRIGGCLTVDGACFEHTACFYEPYFDKPDTSGRLNYEEDTIRAFVARAHQAGLQVGMHAIGDKAIDVLVGAYAAAMAADPRPDRRHRVEHFQLPTEWAIQQAAALRLALPMQPAFSYLWDRPERNEYVRSFGEHRAERMEPFARLTREGLMVSGGSDSPVTPIDPLAGIHALVNNPRQSRRTSLDTAIRMFTYNGAWVGHEEAQRGSIAVGKAADLVALAADPHAIPSAIADIDVQLTVCDGVVTHAAGGR